jgi:hypothetical protein
MAQPNDIPGSSFFFLMLASCTSKAPMLTLDHWSSTVQYLRLKRSTMSLYMMYSIVCLQLVAYCTL